MSCEGHVGPAQGVGEAMGSSTATAAGGANLVVEDGVNPPKSEANSLPPFSSACGCGREAGADLTGVGETEAVQGGSGPNSAAVAGGEGFVKSVNGLYGTDLTMTSPPAEEEGDVT